jgi:hypothetical protein
MDALVLGSHVIDRARPDFPEGLRKRITHDAPSGNCHSH